MALRMCGIDDISGNPLTFDLVNRVGQGKPSEGAMIFRKDGAESEENGHGRGFSIEV